MLFCFYILLNFVDIHLFYLFILFDFISIFIFIIINHSYYFDTLKCFSLIVLLFVGIIQIIFLSFCNFYLFSLYLYVEYQ